jgi:hypothetical protein
MSKFRLGVGLFGLDFSTHSGLVPPLLNSISISQQPIYESRLSRERRSPGGSEAGAGIQYTSQQWQHLPWMPAFAGMTMERLRLIAK